MNTKTIALIIGAVALAVSLSACGPQKAEVTQPSSATETTSTTTPSVKQETAANPKIGDTVTYPDGIKVTVKDLGEFTPSQTAAGVGEGIAHKFEITLENGSSKNLDPNLFHVTAASGGKQSTKIFDSANGIEMEPTTTVLPGKSITWAEAYSFVDPADVTVEVSTLDFDHDNIIFTR
ncbi:hypothetical protein QEV61_04535 [Trueperella pyogenes]|uniref:hypothetical protein n=1 Tax=Trueperella pyogenes TaxID=1661 RepID=UPI00324D9D7D